ncbi:response regulator [Acidisoma cladoniae]|uniref:response regulator n=1 Tax=Acidisoma cladoniae TaxID=3040935 RepID=UPI00254FD2FD|nr:response regulator [Acidisoma sp. PAMC 29798]
MIDPASILDRKRVLVVEDEMLVALLIEDLLYDLGCIVIGPFGTLRKALDAAASEAFDLAVLDVNLAGERAYPVAEVLTGRNIPFVFLSGYGQSAMPRNRPEWKVCSKPFRREALATALASRLVAHTP